MNTTLILYCYFLLLLLFYKTEGADPLESLIRNGWLMIRDYGEKVITNIAIPRTSDVPDGVSTAFQLDPNKKKALDTIAQMMNTCPRGFPIQDIKGLWHVTRISKRMLHTTFVDIHEAIEKLSSGLSIGSRKSLFSLFKSDPVMRCFQMTVLNDSTSSPFEFSYLSTDSQRKSIIGHVSRASSTQLTLHLASIIDIPFLVVQASPTFLILSQTDTIPTSCESFLVLERNPTTTVSLETSQALSELGANSASNPIISMNSCNDLPSKIPSESNSIIKPASQVNRLKLKKFIL
ncbi:START domain-containing protein [Caenorhabditis elegans]|uniref:START domain-containing protein n=1 Tax=Caenorhabditis elegans TaxID=6239 RepID=Q9U394_CAEEL|nr:START domain-containing protein [Caenorhabditis elegans]CAB57903.3 START domain-containing protein [Caenorhabditis elegans]